MVHALDLRRVRECMHAKNLTLDSEVLLCKVQYVALALDWSAGSPLGSIGLHTRLLLAVCLSSDH